MPDRMIRINSLVKEEIGYILQHDMKNTDLGFTTVLRAEISRDLNYGKVFVSILGTDDEKERIIETLNNSAGYIQKLLSSRVRLRYTPKLVFIYDDVIEHSMHIQDVLKQIHEQKERELQSLRESGELEQETEE
ncbi:MAG: 30S ribosome-binding factor RbfA [Candidatus Auribacterota bacterium]